MDSLIENYWMIYKDKIIKTQFCPYICYLVSVIFWFMFALHGNTDPAYGYLYDSHSRVYQCTYYPLLGFVTVFMLNQINCEKR